ncbi:MAG: WG repeat-containing protein [Porphyromonadaceae bacterium]|jgi:hypothetical protein|nr:WG repeat-containing protein [Porphyromonadaceae bacterium]
MKLFRHIARRSALVLALAASLVALQAVAVGPGLQSFKKGNFYGFEDQNGNMVIPAQFNNVMEFSHGLAAVCVQGKWGYIDPQGTLVIQPQFDNAGYFSEDLAKVRVNGKYGFIDRTGKFVIEPMFDDASQFSRGTAWVTIGDEECFIDRNGNRYADRADAAHGESSIGQVAQNVRQQPAVRKVETVAEQPAPRQEPVRQVQEPVVPKQEPVREEVKAPRVPQPQRHAVVPQTPVKGEPLEKMVEVVQIQPDSTVRNNAAQQDTPTPQPVQTEKRTSAPVQNAVNETKPVIDYSKISDKDVFPFAQNGKYGYKTTTGAVLIHPQFDNALYFSEGLAPVFINGKWGYVDFRGNIIVPVQYDEVGSFFMGAAWAKKNGEETYLDRNGRSHDCREAASAASSR